MANLLNPKLDIVFKYLLAGDTEILTDLINAVLKLPDERRIRSAEVRNPIILPEEIIQKFIILDILAVDEFDRRYDIEMQVSKYLSYPKRTVYYLSKLYAGQLNSGEDYDKLRPVIGIHFLDYEEFPDYADFRFRFEMRDSRHPELRLCDDLCLYLFELPKFEKLAQKEWQGNCLTEWLHFFNHAHEEDQIMRNQYRSNVIRKAFTALEKLSADEKTRHLAEVRERALKNEVSMLGAAKREGIEIGKKEGVEIGKKEGVEVGRKEGVEAGRHEKAVETARNLLAVGVLTSEQISKVTGLSLEEVELLANRT